ncbi:DUF6875 domain-containing protein [Streptomyces sp. AK02-01A]|uniref:DUF6875 domain-containing protein n=1 Tax=Streptomyces sp. AK02-01A TaxID=3028648 RepID=UPI0039F71AF4
MAGRPAAARVSEANPLPEPARTWVYDFVAAPHRQLLRPGALCPALPLVLELRQLYWGPIDYAGMESSARVPVHGLASLLREALGGAVRILTASGDEYRTAVLWLIESVPRYAYRAVIEPAFLAIRAESVEAGIMVGCFHPYRQRRSRVQPDLMTMRSPVPMIAMRRLMRSDLHSIKDEPRSLEAFHRYFAAHDRDRRTGRNSLERCAADLSP